MGSARGAKDGYGSPLLASSDLLLEGALGSEPSSLEAGSLPLDPQAGQLLIGGSAWAPGKDISLKGPPQRRRQPRAVQSRGLRGCISRTTQDGVPPMACLTLHVVL